MIAQTNSRILILSVLLNVLGGFNKILERLTAVGFSDPEHTTALTNKQRLMIALWYFGNPEGYRAISQRFGVAMSTAHGCVQEVTQFLGKLQSTVVSISPDLEDTAQRFSRYGFPGVIGAIDGTHVRVLPPALHKADYLNRHGIACINLTAVCDGNGKITYLNVGYTGKVNDARIFNESQLKQLLDSGRISSRFHIIGDAAYGLHMNCLTPYEGELNSSQELYNFRHSSTRMMIERVFGLLKSRKSRKLMMLNCRV